MGAGWAEPWVLVFANFRGASALVVADNNQYGVTNCGGGKRHSNTPSYDIYSRLKNLKSGNSLVVQWLGLHAFTAEGASSIPGWGTKILQAAQRSQK